MKEYGIGILSGGHYLPRNIQTNEELCRVMTDTDPEWIVNKTGIKRRFIAEDSDSCSGMGTAAADQALLNSGISAEEIGLIIVATFSPDYMFPPVSAKIQQNLGAVNAQIIDINTNCTGFVTALTIAAERMLNDPEISYALVIGSELHTRYINPKDKETAIFFSDGAGAALLGKVRKGYGLLGSAFHTDSSTYEAVRFRGGGSSFPFTNRSFNRETDYIEMNGLATWKQAVTNLPVVIKKSLEKAGKTAQDVDLYIFHQANLNLINYVMQKLKISLLKTYTNIQEIGNTGSASIGIALSEALENKTIKPGTTLLLAGVGAGFNFGASIWKFE